MYYLFFKKYIERYMGASGNGLRLGRKVCVCVFVCLFVCVFVPALPTHLATHPSTHLATHLVTHPCRPPTRRPTQRTSPRHPLPLERPNLPFGLVFLSFRLSSQAFSPKKAQRLSTASQYRLFIVMLPTLFDSSNR